MKPKTTCTVLTIRLKMTDVICLDAYMYPHRYDKLASPSFTLYLRFLNHTTWHVYSFYVIYYHTENNSRSGLVDALMAHYGSPGRLADYRRQFERTTRTVGEGPAIFAAELETLAGKAFGDMGQMARLHLIRDRFLAGHSSCELRPLLDSVPPRLQSGTWWIVATFGRATPTRQFAGLLIVRIRSIQPMLSEMPTGPVRPQEWRQSPDRVQAQINWRIYFVG